MISRKKQLRSCSLYLILDTSVKTYDELLGIARTAIDAGVDVVQLRDKKGQAQDILKFSKEILKIAQRRALYIINDRVDLAEAAQADGVHLGQEDLSVAFARRKLGPKALIGKSCQTLGHLKAAENEQADYIGFGSVFKTQTKPERLPMNLNLLKQVMMQARIPVFAIGGITIQNLASIKSVGVNRVAVCREICLAQHVQRITKEFKRILRD